MEVGLNQQAFDTFWYYINERHRVHIKRQSERWPWTTDIILQTNRFCNVFRRLDNGTRFLDKFILSKHGFGLGQDGLLLYNIFLYRAFNKPATYAHLLQYSANLVRHETTRIIEQLEWLAQASGESLYGSAYMLRGFSGKPKHVSITETLAIIWEIREALAAQIRTAQRLRDAFYTLLNAHLPGWGEFTCYQVALDLTYCSILSDAEDINEWCAFGWGAKEGLRQIWPAIRLREEDMLAATRWLLAQSPKYVQNHMPPLNLQDIEFNLCEAAKYNKIAAGGRQRRRYIHP